MNWCESAVTSLKAMEQSWVCASLVEMRFWPSILAEAPDIPSEITPGHQNQIFDNFQQGFSTQAWKPDKASNQDMCKTAEATSNLLTTQLPP